MQLGDRLRDLSLQESAGKVLPGWNILHTPGHTAGHVSFFRGSDRVLIAGDAFCTTKPESFFDAAITQPPELHGPPAYFTPDWNTAIESIQKLATLNPVIIASGHGKPLADGKAGDHLRLLAERSARR